MAPTLIESLRDFEQARRNLQRKKCQVQINIRKTFSKILKNIRNKKSTLRRNRILLNRFNELEKTVQKNLNQSFTEFMNEPLVIKQIQLYIETCEISHLFDVSDEEEGNYRFSLKTIF